MKTRVGRWAPMVVVPAMLLALAGCSGDSDNEGEAGPGDETSATDSPSEETTTDPTSISPELRTPPRLREGASGGVADVEWDQSSCKTEEGTQTVEGTVTNPSRRPLDYVITMSWTNDTSDVRALGFATLRQVPSGQETDWRLRAEVPEGATQCIINVTRGRLASSR